MIDATAPGAPARLYSQTHPDCRGNFYYRGDLYKEKEETSALAARIDRHLHEHFPDMRFSVRTERFSMGRKILAEVLTCPADLTGREAQSALIIAVRDQMERFGFSRSNALQDYFSTSFYADVQIGRAYWVDLASRRGRRNPVDPVLSLAAFKKRIKPGDQLKLVDAPEGHRALGITRTIISVRSADLIFEGRVYLEFPRASAFACDGRYIRVAIGQEHDPDAHLLYEWLPQAAA
jgi:hypothetical protein